MGDGRFTGRDGTELAYRELGTGRPLVLVHGIFGTSGLWLDDGPGPRLAEQGHRVIAPDLRGHGGSAAPHDAGAYPADVLADDGLALIEALGLDDYDLAGYSLGGRIVVRLLVRGARPRRAVVGGQGLEQITAERETSGANRVALESLIEGRPLPEGSPEAGIAAWLRRHGGDPVALRHVLDSLVATPREALAGVPVPTLVVVGDTDRRRATARDLADALPNGWYAEVAGDHLTALSDPVLADVLGSFLAG